MRYSIYQREFDLYDLTIYTTNNTELFYQLTYDEITLIETILTDIGATEITPNYMS